MAIYNDRSLENFMYWRSRGWNRDLKQLDPAELYRYCTGDFDSMEHSGKELWRNLNRFYGSEARDIAYQLMESTYDDEKYAWNETLIHFFSDMCKAMQDQTKGE